MSNAYGIFPKWFKQPVCLLNIFVEVSFENSEIVAPQNFWFSFFFFLFLQSLANIQKAPTPYLKSRKVKRIVKIPTVSNCASTYFSVSVLFRITN